YDLFGPTKTSRKGNSISLRYKKNILFDEPRTIDYTVQVAGYANLETLPEFQNVDATFDKLLSAFGSLNYANLRRSLGAIDSELGTTASLTVRSNFVNSTAFPRVLAEVNRGTLLPVNHTSLWIRGAVGQSLASNTDDPFARFFFGGFGNNWVDHLGVKRFRDPESFAGLEINEIGGANFGKVQAELVLPPLRFRSIGIPSLYLRWASLSLFASGIVTDFDRETRRREFGNVGGQVDLRLVTASHLNSTISFGYAVAAERDGSTSDEIMFSIKVF
ncbi:MAG: hypothetical protein HKN13_05165, partial [Rhodothermales bacterium]|nr:hypothetical protein [Rhodothermales bacterium]